MKIILKSALFAAAFFLAFPFILSAGGELNLSQTPEMSELPYILILPNGDIMVAWTDGGHFNGGGSVWYKIHSESGGWSPSCQVAEPTSAFPQLALDKNGTVHMAYWEGGSSASRDIYYRTWSSGTWSDKELVYDSWGYNSNWQRINVENNTISILWCHSYARPAPMDIFLIEKPIGGEWPSGCFNVSRAEKSTSIHPALRVKNGNVYAAWQDDSHAATVWNIYYAERINGYWSSPVRLNPSGHQYQCDLDVDNQGRVHLIYSGKTGPIYYMKKNPGEGWSEPAVISTGSTAITTFNFLKFSNGSLHALWRQQEGDGNYIFYARGTTGGQWDAPFKISHGGSSEYPGLDIDSQGRVHAVYSDIGVAGERDIFYVRVDQVTSHPVAQFTAVPDTGDPPLQVQFNASSSFDPDGQITSHEWDFGDGNSGSGVITTHTYTRKGQFSAELTVEDNEGNSSSNSHLITVGGPPKAIISAVPSFGSKPLTVYFDGSGSYDPDGRIVSYNWNFGDGSTDSGTAPIHTYHSTGIFTAVLTVVDNEEFQASASVQIQVGAGPVALFTYSPQKGDPPLEVRFDASNSQPSDRAGGSVETYEWDFDDGSTGTGKIIKHTYQKPGIYSAALRITDDQGLSAAVSHVVEVFSKPVARFTFSPHTGLVPLKVNFDGSSSYDEDGRIESYRWIFGDGATGTGKTTAHTYTKGGGYTIWLSVKDNSGWSAAISKPIIVIEEPHPPLNFKTTAIPLRGLFFEDFINRLEWQPNPINTGAIMPVKYRIYRKNPGASQSFFLLTEVDAGVFRYEDTQLQNEEIMMGCLYALSGVDAKGRESKWTSCSVTSGAPLNFSEKVSVSRPVRSKSKASTGKKSGPA